VYGQLKKQEGLPASLEALDTSDEEALKKVHHALLEVDVVSGSLVCTETGRKFPIAAGIPNMLLNQDEIWTPSTIKSKHLCSALGTRRPPIFRALSLHAQRE
jgi:uncharacterized protein YbaR (Trm112 family)